MENEEWQGKYKEVCSNLRNIGQLEEQMKLMENEQQSLGSDNNKLVSQLKEVQQANEHLR